MEIDEDKIGALLNKMDRSQAWLARKIGCPRSSLYRYISGERAFPRELYPRLVAVLGTTDFLKSPADPIAA